MSVSHNGKKKRFEGPGRYRIIVHGHIDETWSDRLAGMRITAGDPEDGAATTVLMGHLRDQTQLSGVLNSLYDLHLSILLVEWLEENDAT